MDGKDRHSEGLYEPTSAKRALRFLRGSPQDACTSCKPALTAGNLHIAITVWRGLRRSNKVAGTIW